MTRRLTIAAALACVLCLCLASAAPAAYDRDSVIVKPSDRGLAGALAPLLERAGAGEVLGTVRGLGARVLRVSGDPAAVAARLNRSPLVQYAEVNHILRATAVPDDARFGDLYGLNNTGQLGGLADADIDAPEGWSAAGLGAFPTTGGVKVGIVDTGIRATHEDLIDKVSDCAGSRGFLIFPGRIRAGTCGDDNGHGSHVAGTIAARANNGVGVAGVAFNSPLAVCKALDSQGSGMTADVANCIGWLRDRGARVISMSLGGSGSETLQAAVARAYGGGGADGSLLVAAAGNSGGSTPDYPAAYPEVISVAATDRRDQRAPFSTANDDVELAAPGVGILSTTSASNSSYGTLSGTSMAAPLVAGVAAVVAGRDPGAPVTSIRAKLQAAADDLGPAGRDPAFGFGRVNLERAAGAGSTAATRGGRRTGARRR